MKQVKRNEENSASELCVPVSLESEVLENMLQEAREEYRSRRSVKVMYK